MPGFEEEGLFGNNKYKAYQPVARHDDEDEGLMTGSAGEGLTMPRATYIPPDGDEQRPWRDVPWAIAYLAVATFGMLVCIIILCVEGPKNPASAFSKTLNAQNWTLVMLVSVLGGCGYSVIFFLVLRYAAEALIYVCLFSTTGAFAILSFAFLCAGYWGLMLLFAFLFACTLVYTCWAQRRVPFAACVLEVAMEAIFAHPYIVLVSYLFFLPEAFSTLMYTSAFYLMLSSSANGFWQFVAISLITVIFFWSTQVSKNIIRTMVSGTVGTWYFYEGSTTAVPYRPTIKALQRACTTSLGSIAFGSAIVAFIQMLRGFIRLFRRTKCAPIVACADWVINIIDGVVQYFNKYAYTYVAIYGMSFLESSKETWHLLRDRGFDVVVNDSLIEGVLNLGAALCSLVIGASIGFIALCAGNPSWAYITTLSMSVTFVMVKLATEAVDGAVATVFVCFAENASAMAQTKPELYGRLVSAWRRRWGEVPSHVAMVAPEQYKAPHPSEVAGGGSGGFLPNDLI